MTSNREWQRLFNPFQLLLRFLPSAKQLLLLVAPGHQDNAPITFTLTFQTRLRAASFPTASGLACFYPFFAVDIP
ncbi:hypothetical protein KFZ89_002412 [Salmonella bongori]|nr:hypothetical protein [Salmonella bongori]